MIVTAKDGSVDLDKTLRNLRSSLKSLPLVEQAAACGKDLAGKAGMTGLLSIVNATDDAYDSLTDSVQNSTQTFLWNQNLGEAEVTGEECSKRIDNLKEVLSQTEYLRCCIQHDYTRYGFSITSFSSDAKVTSKMLKIYSMV